MSEVEVVEGEVPEAPLPALRGEAPQMTVAELVGHKDLIVQASREAMVEGLHYGKIEGVSKPTLAKPGAELLLVMFRLGVDYDTRQEWQGEHLTATTKATLRHIPTGNWVGTGEGLCSTREKKYAYRGGGRACPECGVVGYLLKANDRDEWFCWRNESKGKLGCGAKFAGNDQRITSQSPERVANPDLADTYNTVLKMAAKRALTAAILNATAASEVFTQDVGDGDDPPAPRGGAQSAGGGDGKGQAPAKPAGRQEPGSGPQTTPVSRFRSQQQVDDLKGYRDRFKAAHGGDVETAFFREQMKAARGTQGHTLVTTGKDGERVPVLTELGAEAIIAAYHRYLQPELKPDPPAAPAGDDEPPF